MVSYLDLNTFPATENHQQTDTYQLKVYVNHPTVHHETEYSADDGPVRSV